MGSIDTDVGMFERILVPTAGKSQLRAQSYKTRRFGVSKSRRFEREERSWRSRAPRDCGTGNAKHHDGRGADSEKIQRRGVSGRERKRREGEREKGDRETELGSAVKRYSDFVIEMKMLLQVTCSDRHGSGS